MADDLAARAAELGFPKLKYTNIERERRWLCAGLPDRRLLEAEAITDLYVNGTRLRLREAVPLNGGPVMRRLTRKADLAADQRLITSIYLTEVEYALFRDLPGLTLRKVRHTLADGLSVDRFQGPLEGLFLAEAEFDTDEAMAGFPVPDFAVREVTDDPRYTGGALVRDGVPE